MALFKDWQDFADKKSAEPGAEQYWTQYFLREKDFYEKLLKGEAPKSGTVQALADHFGVDIIEMTGYLDGINESLKAENDLENMTTETEVSLDYEPEKLYYNMVGAKAEWLYKLPQWDSILTEEKRKELYKAQKSSTIRAPAAAAKSTRSAAADKLKIQDASGVRRIFSFFGSLLEFSMLY